jgi:hypothetical protein
MNSATKTLNTTLKALRTARASGKKLIMTQAWSQTQDNIAAHVHAEADHMGVL